MIKGEHPHTSQAKRGKGEEGMGEEGSGEGRFFSLKKIKDE